MKLIAESFQRQLVIKQFKSWFVGTMRAFVPKLAIPQSLPMISNELEPEQIAPPKQQEEA